MKIKQGVVLGAFIAVVGLALFGRNSTGILGATQTLGNTAVGSSTDSGDSNYINGSRFTMPATAGVLSKISVYVNTVAASPNNQFEAAIYSDAGGVPGALVASSASTTLTAKAWTSAPLNATLAANTAYWLVYNTNGTSAANNDLKYSSGGLSIYSSGSAAFGAWPASFGAGVPGGANFSIYATYDTGGASPTPTATAVATATPTPRPSPTATPVQTATATPTQSVTATVTPGTTATATPTVSPTPTGTPVPTGGTPILLITSSAASNPFGKYFGEILKAEGLNEYSSLDISQLTAGTLASYDVALLSEMTLTPAQVSLLTGYVNGGGQLIAMRPDKQLAGLLGLKDAGGSLADAYLAITNSGPGAGIVNQPIGYHGTADFYTLSGATSVAALYSSPSAPLSSPAVSMVSVGGNGGAAAAFSFDLARSIVYTRQGNPAWVGQNRDQTDDLDPPDLFFGGSVPDWNNLANASIPIADEEQRLLANLITSMDNARKPVPRFWYYPFAKKAVIVMTGDDHAGGGTAGRFDHYEALSTPGCNVANWECIRSSSYIYTATALTNAQAAAYTAAGFEVGIHVSTTLTLATCATWGTYSALDSLYSKQLSQWKAKYTSLPSPSSERTHCVEWDDWVSQAKINQKYGMRLDANYYYYPASFTQDRPGYFNGTGEPMRFADLDGTIIDTYMSTTQMTDESGQTYPNTIQALLSGALGPSGYYSVFTCNFHTDNVDSDPSDDVVAAAQQNGVPVVSGRQMLTWLDSKDKSSFSNVSAANGVLTFQVSGGANGLMGMVPVRYGGSTLVSIAGPGGNVGYSVDTIKGVAYAFFVATPGTYAASYGHDTTAPTVTSTSPTSGTTGVSQVGSITVQFSKSMDSTTITSSTISLALAANGTAIAAGVSYNPTSNSAVLTPSAQLAANTAYKLTVRGGNTAPVVLDISGDALAATYTVSFTTGSDAPQIGYNKVGASVDNGDAGYMNGSRFVTPASVSPLTGLAVYLQNVSAAPNNSYQMAIYTDANGSPGTLVAKTAVGAGTAGAWNKLPIAVTLSPNTAYWMVYNTNGTSTNLSYDMGTANQGAFSSAATAFGTWPASFGTSSKDGAEFSIYGF